MSVELELQKYLLDNPNFKIRELVDFARHKKIELEIKIEKEGIILTIPGKNYMITSASYHIYYNDDYIDIKSRLSFSV